MNNTPLHTLPDSTLHTISEDHKQTAIHALESGNILYLPHYRFTLKEQHRIALRDDILSNSHKNMSYDYTHRRCGAVKTRKDNTPFVMEAIDMMHTYAEFAQHLIETLLPHYKTTLRLGRTSYRPAEIENRKSSTLKDDTRLHVDAFPSTPVNGNRILRVFCNINPHAQTRVWHVGEPFSSVLERFAKNIPAYSASRARLLRLCRATKSLRSDYDHRMLHLHNAMKLDNIYQHNVTKHRIEFPAESTWIVFTDHVSHAALSGQFVLEQTFYLPVDGMANPALSPLHAWQTYVS